MKPLAVDLFCGLGGWTSGFLAEGYDVVGFDIERHVYGDQKYPAQLVLQDILTVHGSQFRNAACIVASPPCQAYSYMAMPWKRAKQIAHVLRKGGVFPAGYTGPGTIKELNALFDACFRIQREASEAAGRHIPMVVENVKGAQPWVGRAAWHFGSFYLWADVPALMPHTFTQRKVPGFNFHEHEKTGKPGRSFQSASVKSSASPGKIWENRSEESQWSGSHGLSGNRGNSARKAASAQIAKIPFELSRWIARTYRPILPPDRILAAQEATCR